MAIRTVLTLGYMTTDTNRPAPGPPHSSVHLLCFLRVQLGRCLLFTNIFEVNEGQIIVNIFILLSLVYLIMYLNSCLL